LDESAAMTGAVKDDLALMREIGRGESAALKVLYERHGGRVMALGLRMLGDRGEAEQLLVDVFFEIWRNRGQYEEGRANPLTYLMRVTRSRAIDRLRRRGRVSVVALEAGAEVAVADSAGLSVEAEERRVLVASALDSLEADQRRAIECSYYEGLSHQEIARKLEKPLGTVKSSIRLGLVRLKEVLSRRKGKGAELP
jgi:RNA polymerase sigma-70 factor (ECF subfamily)